MSNDQILYPVVEKFISINGEGSKAGELAAFIRMKGCNLACSYCDTSWANQSDCPCDWLSAADLIAWLQSQGAVNVTLTGGEPLLTPHISELIQAIGNAPLNPEETSSPLFQIEIETNGSIPLETFARITPRPSFTMDFKCPGSGMTDAMITDNFRILDNYDTVKFVVSNYEDLEKSREVIEKYVEKGYIYFSPVFGRIDPKDIVDYMTAHHMNGVRIQLQMHKFIWPPDMRGV